MNRISVDQIIAVNNHNYINWKGMFIVLITKFIENTCVGLRIELSWAELSWESIEQTNRRHTDSLAEINHRNRVVDLNKSKYCWINRPFKLCVCVFVRFVWFCLAGWLLSMCGCVFLIIFHFKKISIWWFRTIFFFCVRSQPCALF